MSDSGLQTTQDLVVGLDYGQFYLHTADNDPGLAPEVLGDALGPEGVAQRDGLVVVISPHQNNFEMKFRVEVWNSEPPSDLDTWQEAFQFQLDVDDFGVRYESPTMDWEDLTVPQGRFQAQLTGRGFIAHGWPGSTEPGDEWRLRVWPCTEPMLARRVKQWAAPESDPAVPTRTPDPELVQAGVAAARRIADDLIKSDTEHYRTAKLTQAQSYADPEHFRWHVQADLERAARARALSGELGTVLVTHDFSAPARRLLRQCRSGSVESWVCPMWDDDVNIPINDHGQIHLTALPSTSKHELVYRWNWFHYTHVVPDEVCQLSSDSTLHMTVAAHDGDVRRTTLTVRHDGLPVEWVDDMTDYWRWRLDTAETLYDLGN